MRIFKSYGLFFVFIALHVIAEPILVTEQPTSPLIVEKDKPVHKPKKITNAITKKDIGYKYLFIVRYPEKFTVTVNNKELKTGESTTITDTDTFEVNYAYEWWSPWQIYKGSGTKKYRIPSPVDDVQITFIDWHNPGRIQVAKAELLEENRVFADQKKSDKGKKRHGK